MRGSLKAEARTYVTDIPARNDARIWVSGIGLDGELGWQVAGDWGQAAVLAGVAWRDYTLSPVDSNSGLGSNQLHVRVSAQGHLIGADDWGAFWYGDYVSGVDEWFAETRPYYRLDNGLKLGPEFSLSGGKDYLHARAGVSVMGWEFTLPWAGTFWAGGSAGALWDTDGSRVEPYGAIHPDPRHYFRWLLNGQVSRPNSPSSWRVCTPMGISFQRFVFERELNRMSQKASVLA